MWQRGGLICLLMLISGVKTNFSFDNCVEITSIRSLP